MTWCIRQLVIRPLAVCSVVLTAGCTVTVAGAGQPARDSAGIIGIGRTIPQILPTETELSAVLGSGGDDDGFPPSVGGVNVLPDFMPDDGAACAGVVYPFNRHGYEDSPVRAVAHNRWSGVETRFSVETGAIALASSSDAKTLFTRFVGQWQRCQGQSVVLRHKPDEVGIPDYRNEILNVKASDSMLTAVVMLSPSGPGDRVLPSERAVGVAYNCIIDVEVTDFRWRQDDALTTSHAKDVVKKMMAKAGA